MSEPSSVHRRRFVKLTAAGLVAAPLANALFSGNATATDMVSESDPKAVALKYKMDATKSPERNDPNEVCGNCALYTGKPGDTTGTCEIFDGRLVTSKGWCASWEGF